MPRLYHSPSSVSQECDAAWAYTYIDKIRDPDIDYADIASGKIKATFKPEGTGQCTYKQRGAAVGKGGHDLLDRYFSGAESIDWRSVYGQVAHKGIQFYPTVGAATFTTEMPIGDTPIPYPGGKPPAPDRPTVGLECNGILWVGYRDLLVEDAAAELARLGIPDPRGEGVAQLDHKFTSVIDKYALTAGALLDDVQANLYALDVYRFTGLRRIPSRWVYHETQWLHNRLMSAADAYSEPRDALIEISRAEEVIGKASERARYLDTLTDSASAPRNLKICTKFAGREGEIGCSFHVSNGGRCDARPHITVSNISRKITPMAAPGMNPEMAAKFEKMKADKLAAAAAKGGAAPAATTTAPPPPPPPPATRAPRKPRATVAAVVEPEPDPAQVAEIEPATAPASGKVATILALQTELAEAQAAADVADAEAQAACNTADDARQAVENVLTRIAEACAQ
jgi:hypothetical protein